MHFLHTDAQKAADSICDQDIDGYYHSCLANLCIVSEGRSGIGMVYDWLKKDSMNYHWLAYFCECLHNRVSDMPCYHKVKLLRVCSPTIPRCLELTTFPYVHDCHISFDSLASVVAAYRAHYVQNRFERAEWKKFGCPGWFLRLANTILPERSREVFLLRMVPAGLSRPDHQGSLFAERKDVRDGPVANVAGGPTGLVRLW